MHRAVAEHPDDWFDNSSEVRVPHANGLAVRACVEHDFGFSRKPIVDEDRLLVQRAERWHRSPARNQERGP